MKNDSGYILVDTLVKQINAHNRSDDKCLATCARTSFLEKIKKKPVTAEREGARLR